MVDLGTGQRSGFAIAGNAEINNTQLRPFEIVIRILLWLNPQDDKKCSARFAITDSNNLVSEAELNIFTDRKVQVLNLTVDGEIKAFEGDNSKSMMDCQDLPESFVAAVKNCSLP